MNAQPLTADDLYPSKYLKAGVDILEGQNVTLTIQAVMTETFGEGADAETKPVLTFNESGKFFVLNKTNVKRIAAIHGAPLAGWTGKTITLFVAEVEFQGKPCKAIRVREQAPAGQQVLAAVAPV